MTEKHTHVLINMGYFTSEFSSTDGGKISLTRALKSVPAMGTSMNDMRGRVTGVSNCLSFVFVSQSRAFTPPVFKYLKKSKNKIHDKHYDYNSNYYF